MKVLRRPGRLARIAGSAALTLGLAGMAAAAAAPARASAAGPKFVPYAVASWGSNLTGVLGNGTTNGRTRYGDITGLPSNVAQISAGHSHTLALTPDGTAWAWGGNGRGELGDGTEVDRYRPVRVTGLTGVIQVAAGASHSLALRSDGTVWAWGRNDAGQVGNGTMSSAQDTPVQVTGLTGITRVSAGFRFSLALRSDGTVWAWGANQFGQLGNGTTAGSAVPVQVAGLTQVTNISAGIDFALATRPRGNTALTAVWAWGGNSTGQLGDGTLADHTVPEPVNGINTAFIASIASGDEYAAVLGTDGSVWAWGADQSGQLGNAPAGPPVTRPVNTIGAGSGITRIAAGTANMLALKSNGTVLAWGSNSEGQLGIGSTTSVVGPVQVTGLTGATQVGVGRASGFAIHAVPLIILP
jgi:alpha-tubulin suppressor-like RCC1 family protein